ncbi:MAG: tetratricopeptide repeat protein [Thermoanaerobaculia bacterium]
MRNEATGLTDTAFEELRNRGLRAIETGELEEAAESFAAALRLADEQGDPRRIDLALCNWAAAVIELGRGDGEVSRLREVLLRNSDLVNCRMAAYDIARYYELKKNYKKALFYARITRDRSELLGRRDWLASSHNLIGNTLLAECFVEEACVEYEKALELFPPEPSPARGQILDNLGYCRILQQRYQEGYRLLYEGLRLLRRFGARRREISVRLDLCFAHLETGRYQHSRRQGLAALALAESLGDTGSIKNALYLLGEVANLSDDLDTARGYFARLHREFFPDAGYLPEFLLAVDIRRLVNLHA